jgi:hypothetical protein
MEERGTLRIEPGVEVFDRDNHKLGTVTHIYELDAPPQAAEAAGARSPGYLEVTTGLLSRLGLARPLFVPLTAIRDVTEGGVFLAVARAETDREDWHTRPTWPDINEAPGAAPSGSPAADVAPAPADAAAVTALADWKAAAPHYRRRWEEQHGAAGRWEAYEPRYRFAWEMARLPGYAGQPWPRVRAEFRDRWEVLHPDTEWDTVADAVRDAWEHVAGATERSPSGAAPRL